MKKLSFLAIIAMAFAFVGCDQNKPDNYADYPQLIVGKWFNFSSQASVLIEYKADGSFYAVGYDNPTNRWFNQYGTYCLEGNKLIDSYISEDGTQEQLNKTVEITDNTLVFKTILETPDTEERINYRVQESFDIKGNYSYLNSAVRVVPADGKTALQLPEGVLFQGQNAIPVEAMHGDRIVDVMKKFFADATFEADGKLNHTMDGVAKTKTTPSTATTSFLTSMKVVHTK